jgi:hypothetical protein
VAAIVNVEPWRLIWIVAFAPVATTTSDLRASQLGTLGTALVLSNQFQEGIPLLEQALARGGLPGAQAMRAFFLGEGLRALGDNAAAADAYRRAATEAPANDFGRRAQQALDGLRPYRG